MGVRFPLFFVFQQAVFMQPVVSDFVRSSSVGDAGWATDNQELNAVVGDCKRLRCIQKLPLSFPLASDTERHERVRS